MASSIDQKKGMKGEHPTLVLPLKMCFEKEGGNTPIIDFKIKGGKIDVINYNKTDKVFDIVECKIANNPVKIGQTFGQVLAYSSIIKDDGWRFFEAVLNKTRDWLTPKELNKIFIEKNVRVRLWVCFEQKGVRDKYRILSDLRNKFKEGIGVILIDKGNVEITHKANVLPVSIRIIYNKVEFYEKIREDIKGKFTDIRLNKDGRYPDSAKFNFVHPSIHFEVWIKKREGVITPIEIGLHLGCDKVKRSGKAERNIRIFNELLKRKKVIRNKLRYTTFERWGKKVEWYKVYERYPYSGDINKVDEKILKTVEKKLVNYIKTLKPILEEMDWGRRRGIKKT